MTDKQVWSEIKRWVNRLRLNDWGIGWKRVDAPELENGDGARYDADQDYQRATLTIAVGVEDHLVKGRIRHEVLHLALDELDEVFAHTVNRLGPEAREMARSAWRGAEERVVTRLCRAFEDAEHLHPPGIEVT